MRTTSCVALAVILLYTGGCSQESSKASLPSTNDRIKFADNVAMPKGGLGIISKHLYIVLDSDNNDLLFGRDQEWTGLNASTREVVVFFEGRIWSSQILPEGFDLSKAIVVSFEGEKVRFFDFDTMSGGYYKRLKG